MIYFGWMVFCISNLLLLFLSNFAVRSILIPPPSVFFNWCNLLQSYTRWVAQLILQRKNQKITFTGVRAPSSSSTDSYNPHPSSYRSQFCLSISHFFSMLLLNNWNEKEILVRSCIFATSGVQFIELSRIPPPNMIFL